MFLLSIPYFFRLFFAFFPDKTLHSRSLAVTYMPIAQKSEAAAARYAKQCYQTSQQLGDPDALSSVLNTLAAIYIGANLPHEAEQYVLRGIDYCRQAGNQGRLSILYGMASEAYHAMGRQELALDYAQKGLAIEQQLGRKDKEAIRLTQMAEALTGLARFSEAREALEKAIPQLQKDQNYQSLGIACNKMGELLLASLWSASMPWSISRLRRAASTWLPLPPRWP